MTKPRPWSADDTATLMKYAPFAYDHEIAKITGHCRDTVQRRRSAMGIAPYCGPVIRYGTWSDLVPAALLAIRASCQKAA